MVEYGEDDQLKVSVAFALPDRQEVVAFLVPRGTSVDKAIAMSGIQSKFPDMDLASLHKGIWYEKKDGETEVSDGDRIEIYRPLMTDAKEARRLRAERRDKG